jgi:SOS-response transcriptional repressor LexA
MTTREHVYQAICEHWRDYAVPPTRRQIQLAAQISSTSVVNWHFKKLAEDGKIILSKRHPVPTYLAKIIKESLQT